jgi:tetratricopeptide (TPR) repeat protein
MNKLPYILLFLIAFNSFGQFTNVETKYLLMNERVQIESTNAVNNLYNFKFEEAEREFLYIRFRYPNHPLPYFLLGLSEWWKIFPELEESKDNDERFIAYMDTSIELAEKIYKLDKNNAEAIFFLAAAYGFKGRLYSDREQWTKATFAAKNAISYMNDGRKFVDLSPEFLFGDAIYNYYREWVPKNYLMLRPIVAMFPKGDMEKGLVQLKEVANNAFYTRVEAQTFVMRIYANEENDAMKAYPTAKYLAETFPDNAFFQRYHARTAFMTGRWDELEPLCRDIISKVENKQTGYQITTARYAYFYLGYITHLRKFNYFEALHFYERAIDYGLMSKVKQSGYVSTAMLQMARIYEKQNDTDKAILYYDKFMDYANKSKYSAGFKEAKDFKRKYKKKAKK